MSILVEQQDEQINVIETQAAGVEVDTEVGYVNFYFLHRTHPEQHSVQSRLHRKSRRLRTRRTEKALDLRRYHPHRAHHCRRHRWYRSQQGRRQELQHLRFGHFHHHFLSGATRSTPLSAFLSFCFLIGRPSFVIFSHISSSFSLAQDALPHLFSISSTSSSFIVHSLPSPHSHSRSFPRTSSRPQYQYTAVFRTPRYVSGPSLHFSPYRYRRQL